MKEQWKLVKEKNFEDLYLISNYGNLYSIRYNKPIKTNKDKKGYDRATLHNKMKQKNVLIHRLVAIAFIPNPEKFPFVLHKKAVTNGGTNNVNNLYWGTALQNDIDKRNDGHNFYKNNNGYYKGRKINQFDLQHNFIKQWECIAEASKTLNIHREQISRVCRKCPRRKSTHGFIFEYADE